MISENIKTLRKNKGLSQDELAGRIGVVRQTVSKWEKGISVPDAEMIIEIAELFEVSVADILGEKMTPYEDKSEIRLIAEKLEQTNAILQKYDQRRRGSYKIVGIIAAIFAGINIIGYAFMAITTLMAKSQQGAVGVIGGADGPTEIIVTSTVTGANFVLIQIAVGLFLAIMGFYFAKRK
ncbi:MAG: helix-turn-helix transcriptional regulator [Bacillota bacterium]